ncbi:MAG: exonuclease domain-containing protein [Actinomycetota bacterium]|nr:exonuclease domain-containing protein [Actinomycetota bacterium]
MSASFVALDVETANRHRGSICCIGLAVVEDGRLVATEQWLTHPPASLCEFEGINIGIHGIHADDVATQPTFRERLDQLASIVGDRPLVAHNASFDTAAIVQACEADQLQIPSWWYTCSRDLAKRSITAPAHSLDVLCGQLGIELEHHRAGADAVACALLTLHMIDLLGARDVPDLAALLQMKMRRLGDKAAPSDHRSSSGSFYVRVEEMPPPDVDADVSHPLYGHAVTFTGAFTVPKNALWDMCAEVGATALQNVTKKTTILVVGDGYAGDPADLVTGKAAKARELRSQGHAIDILTEVQFLDLLGPVVILDIGTDWD